MIQNFSAYKAYLASVTDKKPYIFTECSKNLIIEVQNRKPNERSLVIELPISSLYIDETIERPEDSLYQRIISYLLTRKLLEAFPELGFDLILTKLISSNNPQELLKSLAQTIKEEYNLDIYINFYITEGISNALQRAINNYLSDPLIHSRIYTIYNDLITYRKSDGTILDIKPESLNNIKLNPKKNNFN